jgi:SRSO17 transposase
MSYELDAQGEQRLDEYVSRLGRVLRHKTKREAFALYTIGLMSNLERKSVEPIAGYVDPNEKTVGATYQRLLHFLGDSLWDDREVRLVAARYAIEAMEKHERVNTWMIDDTGFLKQGEDSVGVKRQYTGSAGKITNCQVGVSLSVSTPTAHVPIDFEIYLPEEWANDPERRRQAKIPEDVVFMTKPELALKMIERAGRAEIPGEIILADGAYGDSIEFRSTIRLMGFDDGLGVSCTTKVICVDEQGEPLGAPVSAEDIATGLPESAFERLTWREGTSKPLSARFVFKRVRVCGEGPDAEVQWLIIEWRDGEESPQHFTLTTLGMDGRMSKEEIVRKCKERYRTEQVDEEMKGELGLDHFEGRGFPGWHHHVTVVLCCYAFVVAERALHGLPSLSRETVRPDRTHSFRLAA